MYRFTIYSFRDRYRTTAADEWGCSERQVLEQGSWADAETVRKFYLGPLMPLISRYATYMIKVPRLQKRAKQSNAKVTENSLLHHHIT